MNVFRFVYIIHISICLKYLSSFAVSAKANGFFFLIKSLKLDAQVDVDVMDVRMPLAREKVRTPSMNSYFRYLMHYMI